MKKITVILFAVCFLVALPLMAQAYQVTINDPNGDQIGDSVFDTHSITYNVNESPLVVRILTNFLEGGYTVGSWHTMPADLILWGEESSPPALAIPLVSHGSFEAGKLYTVTNWYTADEMAALNHVTNPPYSWGFGQNVWIEEGTYTGFSGFVAWDALGVTYTANGWYWSDQSPQDDFLKISWATSTCANDVVGVPEPASLLLLGCGLLGVSGLSRRKSHLAV